MAYKARRDPIKNFQNRWWQNSSSKEYFPTDVIKVKNNKINFHKYFKRSFRNDCPNIFLYFNSHLEEKKGRSSFF